jgi:hypothetical protein
MSKASTAKSKAKSASKGPRRAAVGPMSRSIRKVAKPGISEVKVTSVRLEPALRRGLVMLQGILKMPMNKLVNQAVGDFIKRRTAAVETDLEAVLKQVKEYRKRDPKFKEAIRLTAEAEAQAFKDGVRDPAQGTTYLIHEREVGPAQSMVRELLSNK